MSSVIPEPLSSFLFGLPTIEAAQATPNFDRERSQNREAALRTEPREESAEWNEQLAWVLIDRGQLEQARWHAQSALQLATDANDEHHIGDALRTLANVQIMLGDIDRARQSVAHLEGYGYVNKQVAYARYMEVRGLLSLRTGNLESRLFFEGESRFRAAIRAYQLLDDEPSAVRSLVGLASCLAASGMYQAAAEAAIDGLRKCVAHEIWRYVPALLLCRALALRDLGIHGPTHALFEEAIEWGLAVQDIPNLNRLYIAYGMLIGYSVNQADLSELPHAEAMFLKAVELGHASNAKFLTSEAYFSLAALYRKLDMTEKADEAARLSSLVVQDAEAEAEPEEDKYGLEAAQQSLDASRHERFRVRMRETIEGTPDALFVLDPIFGVNGGIADLLNEFRNTAGNQLCKCHPTDVHTLTQLESFTEFAGIREHVMAAIQDRRIFEDEIRTGCGVDHWIARRVVPVGDGVAITMRDVTLQHDAEVALREAAQHALEADRAKTEFLANMSHEVRTPINGVLGLARLLEETSLDGIQQQYVNGIVSSADILLAVIGDILDLSKIEAGKVEFDRLPDDLHKLVKDVVGLFRGQAQARYVTIDAELDDRLPAFVEVDSTRLKQVLANLIGNAVKFTSNGTVWVSVRPAGENIRFEIADTGVGIADDRLEYVFEPFRQGSQAARLQGGTGLGLTISRRIVELMGGQIGVRSRLGQGSTFWFEVPLPATTAEPSAPPVSVPTTLAGLKVLLVEDNAVNIMVAEGILRGVGCGVEIARDGHEALEKSLNDNYAAILMDVRMPGMDGLEATRLIRAREQSTGKRIPILALTASAFTDDREECLAAGMDGYLGKPFTAEALRSTLARLVQPDSNKPA